MSLWKFNDIRPSMVLQCSSRKPCKKSGHYYVACVISKGFCSQQPSFLFWKIGLEKRIFKTVKFKVQNTIGGGEWVSKEMFVPPSTLKNSSSIVLKSGKKIWTDFFFAWPILNFFNFRFFSDVKGGKFVIMSQFNSILLVLLVLATTEKGISKGKLLSPLLFYLCWCSALYQKMLSI